GIQLSTAAMSFAAAASLFTVLLFGLFPAIQATRADLALVIREKASHATSGRRMVRFRGVLVTAQIAFSVVLLVLAGLFSRSLIYVACVILGLNLDSGVVFSVSPRENANSPERTWAVFDRIEEELAALPGVPSVGSAGTPLLTESATNNDVAIQGVET